MNRSILVYTAIVLLTSLMGCISRKPVTDASRVIFTRDHSLVFNCADSLYIDSVEIATDAPYPVTLFQLTGIPGEVTVYRNNARVLLTDTFILTSSDPLKFRLEINPSKKSFEHYTGFIFKSNHPNTPHGFIRYWYNTYIVSHQQLNSGDTIVIDRKANCLDTVRFFIPSRGTVTSVDFVDITSRRSPFYGDRLNINGSFESRRINPWEDENFIILNRRKVGVYNVIVNACHWSNQYPKRPLIIDYR